MRYRRTFLFAGLSVGLAGGCAEILGIEPWDTSTDTSSSSVSSSDGGASSSVSSSSEVSSSTSSMGGSGGAPSTTVTTTVTTSVTTSVVSSSSTGGTGIFCGGEEVSASGYAVCWELTSASLTAGKYGTITVSLNAPAPSGPSDPITPGCVSSMPATNPDTTDPSVLCPLSGATMGDTVYLALKSYDSNAGNPPLPFYAFRCDTQETVNGKCLGTVVLYKDGVELGQFVHPPMAPFSYHDLDQAGISIQLKLQL